MIGWRVASRTRCMLQSSTCLLVHARWVGWQVMGTARGKNSALEIEMDFDHVAAPPPVITEEVTASLEDIIKKRVAALQWDDVVRVEPSDGKAIKKVVDLDDQKSKKGLGDIYEDEFVKQVRVVATGGAWVASETTRRSECAVQ